MTTVYLAGPITGLNYAGATDWRDAATEILGRHGITGMSPMRWKKHLSAESAISYAYTDGPPLSTQRGVIVRDRWDCQRADVVLFNFLGAERVSIGTCIELGWADSARRPAVIALEPKSVHDHGMVRELGIVVPNLDVALETVVAMLAAG